MLLSYNHNHNIHSTLLLRYVFWYVYFNLYAYFLVHFNFYFFPSDFILPLLHLNNINMLELILISFISIVFIYSHLFIHFIQDPLGMINTINSNFYYNR